MTFPPLKLGDLTIPMPIIQGGMGIGVSMHKLAAAVANEGGVGVISSAGVALKDPDVMRNKEASNIRALGEEIRKARMLCEGVIGVNIMGVLSDFATQVRTSILEKADIILSGAGLPLDLPKYLQELCEEKQQEFHTKLIPIVSSARAASIICRKWLSRFNYLPDAIVVEGPKAGGHLGFKAQDIENPDFALEKILPETIEMLKPFEDANGRQVPVIAAGGVFSGKDIYELFALGAAGVQMGTRFVATKECDASDAFKNAYVNAEDDDIEIINSPVGLPGRALKSSFIDRINREGTKFSCQYRCINTCAAESSPYCISKALMNAVCGNLDEGFVFCGANVAKVKTIVTVKELFQSLKEEFDAAASRWLG